MTFTIGVRQELLGRMVEEFKFYGVRALGNVIAEIIDEVLPDMSGEIVLVPLPTISRHIRERGLDHTRLVSKNLARLRGWEVQKVLIRENNTVQIGASAKQRKAQAEKAYKVDTRVKIDEKKTYMLIDDVWTTGSSMLAAEKKLREAGAKNIACVVIVRASDK